MTETDGIPDASPEPVDPAGQTQPFANKPKEPNRDARMWAMFCHLARLAAFMPILPAFGSIIGPLVL
jgi:uncharacterized Tic20 family protein